jgi:acyl-CoA synthetase (AMP-forming)/AMP-acid ligase II
LLRDLTARGQHPAVIAFGEDGVATWDSGTVADKALRLARGLRDAGVGRGSRVAIWCPNSPVWIVAALAVLAAGGVLVPIDDLADAEEFEAALASGAARLIFTTADHLEASGDILRTYSARAILVDEPEYAGQLRRAGCRCWVSKPMIRRSRVPTSRLCYPGPPAPPARPKHSC